MTTLFWRSLLIDNALRQLDLLHLNEEASPFFQVSGQPFFSFFMRRHRRSHMGNTK